MSYKRPRSPLRHDRNVRERRSDPPSSRFDERDLRGSRRYRSDDYDDDVREHYQRDVRYRYNTEDVPYDDRHEHRHIPQNRRWSDAISRQGHRTYDSNLYPNPLYNGNRSERSSFGGNYDGRTGFTRDGQYDRSRDVDGRAGSSRHGHEETEQRRLHLSSRYPDRLFLEDVELPPEFAFRIDTSSDSVLLNYESTRQTEKSSFFTTFYRDNLLGATEEYITKNNILSYKLTMENDNDNESEALSMSATGTTSKSPVGSLSSTSADFISFSDLGRTATQSKLNKKRLEEDLTVDQKRERYNVLTRQNPTNIKLWREFVEFQDQDCADYIKKLKIGKKISILETALRTNPKSTELHFDRLDLMSEVGPPSEVLAEWQKLVAAYSSSEVIWLERFNYSATQLLLFKTSTLLKEFEGVFKKLRSMLVPGVPQFEKPEKIYLLVADLFFSLCLILKTSGYTERAVSFYQAQLEFDFNFPNDQMKMLNDKSGWKAILKLFELFWALGTLRFGEPGYSKGWAKVLETNPDHLTQKLETVGVADSKIIEYEDSLFDSVDEDTLSHQEIKLDRSRKWVLAESFRSKMYWSPWRDRLSDVEDCEDNHRIVFTKEISPFLVYIPTDSFPNSFDLESMYFHHIVNYILILTPDFLPRTHTLESIFAPFSSTTLTDSTTFFSELDYWEKLMDLYYSNPKSVGVETIPEGFQLAEFTNQTTSCITGAVKTLLLLPQQSVDNQDNMENLLAENQTKHHNVIRNVVEQSLEYLSSPFASLLVQMLFRYEQKSLNNSDDDHKSVMHYCKNLMNNDKLRSSVESFGEIGMLEYFGGKKKKAIGLLFKTITSSTKILKDVDIESLPVKTFLEDNWEIVVQLVKIYRLLAEFHVKQQSHVAVNILVALGNHFDLVTPTTEVEAVEKAKPSKHSVMRAKRFFKCVLDYLIGVEEQEEICEVDEEVKATPILDKWDGHRSLDYFCQKSNLIVEWTLAYALFTYLNEDCFDASSDIYESVLGRLEFLEPLSKSNKYCPLIVSGHNIREQLYIGWCKLSSLFLSQHPMHNARVRVVFGKALELFPSSPPLLILYAAVENQCSVVGKLWRSMVNTVKESSPKLICSLHWAPIFMCYTLAKQMEEIEQDSELALTEFGIGGPAVPPDTLFYKMDALFSAAERNSLTRHCPLIWRLHLKHLAIRAQAGKDVKRAHTLFYDAIRNCPTNKTLYMDAIAYFPEMLNEITSIMVQKELVIRLPVEELDLLLNFEDEDTTNNTKTIGKSRKEKKRNRASFEEGERSSSSDEPEVVDITSD